MPNAEPSPSALSTLRILDLSAGIAGGYCTKLLADYGAEVVKVETPGAGDSLRRWGPFPQENPDTERGLLHWYLNANKRGMTLDVTNPAGRTITIRICRRGTIFSARPAPRSVPTPTVCTGRTSPKRRSACADRPRCWANTTRLC